jgi:hypothetical protein
MRKAVVRFAITLLSCGIAAASIADRAQRADCALCAQQIVRIGRAVVPLTGPWKFRIGDDPRWADPNFDDSSWENVDLTPKGAPDYNLGTPEFVPGWTAQGHPGYAGYAWYRLRVRIEQTSGPLSLLMPFYVDDAYQVYEDRLPIGQFGDLTRRKPVIFYTTAQWFPLPALTPGQSTVLAIRFYMRTQNLWLLADSGGMHGPPRVGDATIIAAFGTLARQQLLIAVSSSLLQGIVFLGFAGALLALYWLDRTETVYLWFTSAYFALVLFNLITFSGNAMPGLPAKLDTVRLVLAACWTLFLITGWWQWFELTEKRWLIRLVWAAALIRLVARVSTLPPLLGTVIPFGWVTGLQTLISLGQLAMGLLFALLVGYGIQRLGREGWLALPAALLLAVSLFANELSRLHIRVLWVISGVHIDLFQIVSVALSTVLGILILRRFQRSQQRKQQLETDLRQAQQIQKLLLPQQIPALPGFRIECDYRPAQEIGGDFFQVLEARTGGVLVIIGDVSGKGVKAAMLVALTVGTVRTIAEETEEPQTILERLNRRLVGRMEGGFATCLCARITARGAMIVANAGHLAPWVEGAEIEVPHDLPLGLSEDLEYSERRLQLSENSVLTFISDGVVEAKNSRRELFGFERAREISMRSAAEIAGAAKQFGQDDDITVVTIQRIAVSAYL